MVNPDRIHHEVLCLRINNLFCSYARLGVELLANCQLDVVIRDLTGMLYYNKSQQIQRFDQPIFCFADFRWVHRWFLNSFIKSNEL